MKYYQTILAFHIVFAGIWLIFFVADILLKNQINGKNSLDVKKSLMSLYLKFTNIFGIVGSIGIAITGIVMVIQNPGYGFFDMSHAHWLATKQILFVIILLNTFLKIIPAAKKLRAVMKNSDPETIENEFISLSKVNKLINVLVILNFIFAITHRFYD